MLSAFIQMIKLLNVCSWGYASENALVLTKYIIDDFKLILTLEQKMFLYESNISERELNLI